MCTILVLVDNLLCSLADAKINDMELLNYDRWRDYVKWNVTKNISLEILVIVDKSAIAYIRYVVSYLSIFEVLGVQNFVNRIDKKV